MFSSNIISHLQCETYGVAKHCRSSYPISMRSVIMGETTDDFDVCGPSLMVSISGSEAFQPNGSTRHRKLID